MLDIDLIRRYVVGRTTEEEEMNLLLWLEASEENRRFFAEVSSNFSVHEVLMSSHAESDRDAFVSRLHARMDGESGLSRRRFPAPAFFAGFAVALAVAAFLIFGSVIGRPQAPQEQELLCESNTGSGTRTLILADKTQVYLKPGSEIRYDVSGDLHSRTVELEGEAYFDVARDTLRPFTVKTRALQVKVLGTAFTVNSSMGSSSSEVLLERGSVKLFTSSGSPLVTLKPNQKAVYSIEGQELVVEEAPAYALITGEYNMVTLENATLGNILSSLEHCFGVTLKGPSASRDSKRYYFRYLRSDSVEDVLAALDYLTGKTYSLL